eukprot:g301.t1
MVLDSLPWIEKYRPKSLNDLLGHVEIRETIDRLIDSGSLPHLLFYGPPGTGKTSTILASAKKIFGNNISSMVLELNASDDRGIDVVRNQIKNFASTRKLFSQGVKLIILDEADALTNTAQFALRRVIEKYSKATRFCLICNYANKIIPAVQSRCTRFRFAPLQREQIESRLKEIAKAEGVNLTEDGAEAIIKLSRGDMRRVLNALQSTHMAYNIVNEKNVYLCTGMPLPTRVDEAIDLLLNHSFTSGFRGLLEMCRIEGYAVQDILSCVFDRVSTMQLPPPILSYLYSRLSDIENNLSHATSNKIQLGSIVGAFHIAREMLASRAV